MFGDDAHANPRRECDGHPGAGTGGHFLRGVPAEHLASGQDTGEADNGEGGEAEWQWHGGRGGLLMEGGIECVDGVDAGQKCGDMAGPAGQLFELHPHPADHDHGEKDRLPERLHGGHVVGQHGDHQPQPQERERYEEENPRKLERVRRPVGFVNPMGQDNLHHQRAKDDDAANDHGADDDAAGRGRKQAVAPPYAALALTDHGGGHAEAGAA